MKTFVLAFSMLYFTLNLTAQGEIYLSIPNDGELIEEKTLNFVWQVSSLSNQDNPRFTQELIVTEMQNSQSAFEAIEVNQPMLLKSNIIGTNYFINSSEFPFEEEHKYAWQIRYYLNNVLISKSEVWWFKIAQKKLKYKGFIPLRQKNDGQTLKLIEKTLNVSLITQGDLNLKTQIISSDGTRTNAIFKEVIGQEVIAGEISTSRANNRTFTLDLKELKFKKGIYKLEWTPKRNESYTLNFEIL